MASANGISDRSPLASPHVQDEYGEIFRNFTRGLKVPPVPFLEFSTDFGGGIAEISGDSYSDIFGGFGWDVAVSLEELLGGLIAGAGKTDAEKKARGNGEKKSLEKIPSRLHNFSVEEKLYSSENVSIASSSASEQLHDEKPLTRSYKMTDIPGRENCMNKIHAAEVDSVSRYIPDVDANFCSLVNHHSDIQDAVAYNTCTVSNVSGEVREIKPTITIVDDSSSRSYLPHMHGNDGKQDPANIDTKSHHVEYAPSTCINPLSYSFDEHGIDEPDSSEVFLTVAEINRQTQPHHVEYASSTCINSLSYSFHEPGIDQPDSSEVFLTVAEINLQTQPTQLPPPSRPPPKLDTKRDGKEDSSTNNWHENHNLHNLANSNSGYYRMTSSEASIDEVSLKPCLLPCLDVEMDANSAASASTSAPKEVMDQTRTNTKIAREFNEKRRDILDNQKILEARDRKRGMERQKGEAGQEFFTNTPKMAPGEMKHYGQENWQAKTNPPLEALDLHQGHGVFYPAHGYEENSLKGSSMVVGFDWQKMNISLDNGDQGEDHKGMMPAEENFVHQEGEMGSFLAHTYSEKLLGEGLKGVKGMWGMEKREYKLDEAQRWHVKEKTLNPAVVTYEMKESGNKLMTVQRVQQEEENIGKRKTYEQCKRAGQEIKQQGEKGKEKSPRQWKTSKEIQSFAAAWGANTQKEQEHILKTVQEIGKQEQVQNSRQMLTNNPAEQEEAARLRMDENTYWHEKSDKVFEVFQDVNETSKTQNGAKVISKQETEYRKKGMAQQAMDENSRTTEQIRYFTDAHEREQKEKMQFDKGRQEMGAEKEIDELWRLEEEMEKLWRLEEEVEDARGKGRDTVELETQNANDKVILEVCSCVELAAVDREIAKVPETANAETCKTAEEVQAESWKKSQEEKASRGHMVGMVQATRYGALAEEQPVSDIIREATAESTESMNQAVAEMVASSIGHEQTRDGEPEPCNGTSLSMNTERRSPMSEVQNFSYDVSFEVEIEKRQKARLERCKRTEDRMARALAEMKARDILAEKEQAERNRLGEVLDCDIKRWSHGKEGNLRALLSTLQYILWPESGWNPVPLTEVITSAAVKKTYKKATLCLHPDKVQQKGASIQQKYISEKVFDLLKEAWNNFNSEER